MVKPVWLLHSSLTVMVAANRKGCRMRQGYESRVFEYRILGALICALTGAGAGGLAIMLNALSAFS
jgi:hypothetical protein